MLINKIIYFYNCSKKEDNILMIEKKICFDFKELFYEQFNVFGTIDLVDAKGNIIKRDLRDV